jgi:hypothetical protein
MNVEYNEAHKIVQNNLKGQLEVHEEAAQSNPRLQGPINMKLGPKAQSRWGNIPDDKLKVPKTNAIGCYIVKHKESKLPGIIGRGGIGGRISTLRAVFNNEGKPIRSKKSVTTYPSARPMWKHDPDLGNWEYKFIVTGYKDNSDPIGTMLAEEMSKVVETIMQTKFTPVYSDIRMAGK